MAPYIDEALLDDPDELSRKDSRATLRALASAGAQVREALYLGAEAGIDRLAEQERPRSVLVAAIGGSSIVAEILELLAEPGSPVPVQARRNLPLPGWVGPLDLVVAVSLSGRAPGPLAVAAEAARRGASLLTVGLDDSPLAEVTRRARGIHVGVGRERISSRTALWTLLTPVLVGADRLGLLDAPQRALEQVADRLDERAEELRPSSESFVNPAKLLAVQLAETVPVVLGDGPLGGVAAARASSMLARTARIPALWGELPDAASGIVACFDGPYTAIGGRRPGTYDDGRIRLGDIDTSGWEPHHFAEPEGELMERARGPEGTAGRDLFADPYLDGPAPPQLGLLMLRDAPPEVPTPESVQTETLTDAVLTTARDAGVKVMEARAGAGDPVVRLADHVQMVDFTATYLALGLGLDPSVSPHVADLRDRTS
ncbi:SIS domain-containing protein [Ornithinimicrobium humiphilum]|uniref:Phosphoglucose isomerase-like protein n=1 Tax=Ornithinimicrobium humiphilum TaxID=125288 RepID=A0A543KMD7_9MICO|nr:SIS domain-containing protein [Ornithinimicrobium humiphilum]TQM96245.1 phosphoglucose isomerase-like protein [Ornithinimicrobium humiphilum]